MKDRNKSIRKNNDVWYGRKNENWEKKGRKKNTSIKDRTKKIRRTATATGAVGKRKRKKKEIKKIRQNKMKGKKDKQD